MNGVTLDLGHLDREVQNGEEKLKNGDRKAGIQIIQAVYKEILEFNIDEFDISVREELFRLMRKCATVMYDSAEKVELNQPTGINSRQSKEMDIKDLILVPDEGLQFKDLVGLKNAKVSLIEAVVLPNLWPNFVPASHRWSGVLIFGSSGTGKSKLVRALANTLNKKLELGITFVQLSPSSVLGNHHGDTERLLSAIFRATAERRPCVVIIDEVDSLTYNRNEATNSTEINMVNHFLTILDGVEGTSPVVVIGMTNKPWNIDNAILRRFQKKLYMELPNKKERAVILSNLVTRLQKPETQTNIDYNELAVDTFRFSPCDLCSLVTCAVQSVKCRQPAEKLASRFEAKEGKVSLYGLVVPNLFRPLNMNDLKKARRNINPSNEERDIYKLDAFANEHCPKAINLDEIAPECQCCTFKECITNPLESFINCWFFFHECAFHGC